jgi:hypothetical protein
MLTKDGRALLVDMRSEADIARDGLPRLLLGARRRAAAYQPVSVESSALRRAANAKQLQLLINAAYVAGVVPRPLFCKYVRC